MCTAVSVDELRLVETVDETNGNPLRGRGRQRISVILKYVYHFVYHQGILQIYLQLNDIKFGTAKELNYFVYINYFKYVIHETEITLSCELVKRNKIFFLCLYGLRACT